MLTTPPIMLADRTISKLADRTFILGAFLPTLLFAVALLFFFHDQLPNDLIKDLANNAYIAVYLLLAIWAGAVVLLILNDPLYRFFEGYMFPSRLAEWLKSRKRQHLKDRLDKIRTLYQKYAQEGDKFTELERYIKLRVKLVKEMPSLENDVLPTRFGNAIRAFEVYPRDIYGAEAITIWLRLASVMPKEFADRIQDMRSQIDFLINCCLFSLIIALLGLGRAIYSASWHDSNMHTFAGLCAFFSSIEIVWLLWAGGGVIASYRFYRWAETRVPAWGDLVMSAFDCYLPALAGQLGFELPTTEAERLEFWTTFSQQLIYRREPDGETPFRIEKWKQAQSKSMNKELECGSKTQDGKAEESGNNNDSEDDPNLK